MIGFWRYSSGGVMNKQQAAEYLGVSVRALERYVQQGKISVKYEKGKTRSTANFEETELELFKEQLNQPIVKPAVDSRQISTELPSEQGKIVHHSGEVKEVGEITVIDKLSSIIEGLLGEKQPQVAVGEKILLTVVEVQQLTGLSREFLKEAIAAGQLPAKVIGKSWRVKRSDLDDFIDNLF